MSAVAVIYTRVSTDEQVDNLSLETQKQSCMQYCEKNGLTVDKIFTDDGKSAKTDNRPAFQAMLSYCVKNKGKVNAVVIWHTSRFSRNARVQLNSVFDLNKVGVELHSVTERIDQTPAGRFLHTILAGANQWENEERAGKSVKGMRASIERGRWPFPAPLGYENSRNADNHPTLRHDPKRAPLIVEAFRQYATGLHTKQEVLTKVTHLGLTTVKGRKVTSNDFAKMLRRQIYAGWIVVEKWGLKVRGNFEPIVPQELFERVQVVADDKRPNRPKSHIRDRVDLSLRGSIRCGCCGQTMTGYFATGRHGGKYGYYGCYNKQCANRVTVPKEKIETAFIQHLLDCQPTSKTMRVITEVVKKRWNSRQDVVKLSATHHAKTIEEIETKLTNLESAYVFEKALPPDRYNEHRKKLEQQLKEARSAMADSEVDGLNVDGALELATKVLTNAVSMYEKLPPENRRKFLGVLNPSGWEVERSGTIRTPTNTFVCKWLNAPGEGVSSEWYARRDLNPQPLVPKTNALSS